VQQVITTDMHYVLRTEAKIQGLHARTNVELVSIPRQNRSVFFFFFF